MRRSKELVVLLVAFAAISVFILWYVGQRRAENRSAAPATARDLGPVKATPEPAAPAVAQPAPTPIPPAPAPSGTYVDLKQHDGKTIDLSSGQPVVKDAPEDRAALERGLREIEEATADITFEVPKPAPKKP